MVLEIATYHLQTAEAPFNVIVEETPRPNHAFEMTIDAPINRLREQPTLLATFARRLAATIGGRPDDVLVEAIEDANPHTILRFANASLPRSTCAGAAINATRFRMLTRGRERVLHEFRKAMGAEFHVKKVGVWSCCLLHNRRLQINVVLRDACESSIGTATTAIQLLNVRVSTTTQASGDVEAAARDGGVSSWLLIALIVLCVVLLLAVFGFCYMFLLRRRSHHKKASAEYASKGES